MFYKDVVARIRNLPFPDLSAPWLQTLWVLGAYAAREFAETLRLTISLNPDHLGLKKMASEELQTSNLKFGSYAQVGDHADFAWHFIRTEDVPISREVAIAGDEYTTGVSRLSPEVRVMSIVSREQELSGIFARILQAKDWSAPGLAAFRYYLERHIALDSGEGGHADMLSDFAVDDRVAEFYEIRLKMYRVIPTLFA